MVRSILIAGAAILALSGPTLAQSPRSDPAAAASSETGSMTGEDVGVPPMTGVSTSDYVAQTAAGDLYEIQAGHIAQGKARSNALKSFASTMIKDHGTMSQTLMAALDNAQRKIAHPSDQLPTDKQAMIDQLKATPKGAQFDSLYLGQQLQAHQQAWALEKGYATDGDDASLRQVAASAVPIVEQHLAMLKALPPQQ